MVCTFSNKCAKNLSKRTVLLQLIIKNVVTCFFGTQCRYCEQNYNRIAHLSWWVFLLYYEIQPSTTCQNNGVWAYIPLSDILGEAGADSDDLRLSTLPVFVALLILCTDSSSSSSSSQRFCCSGTRILSNMSPITWKLGSTIKSMKPTNNKNHFIHVY